MIVVESKKKSAETIALEYPEAIVIDVTSMGEGGWVKLSPFYPHGGIPVPFSPGYFSESVEGIWQGLKVFENEGATQKPMHIMSMKNIKRSVKKLGTCLGHQKGLESKELLGYIDARKQIYIPAYEWVLENRCANLVRKLREYSASYVVVLLDFDTNSDIENPKAPLSHASLIVRYIVSLLTEEEKAEWKIQAEENARLSKEKKAQHKARQKKAADETAAKELLRRQKHDEAMVKSNPSQYTPLWLREQLQAGVKPWFLQFYRPNAPLGKIDKACLSLWYSCTFEVDGIKYDSIGQFLMAEKARVLGDEEVRSQIIQLRHRDEIDKVGNDIWSRKAEAWDKQMFHLAVKGNLAKFEQNPSLRSFLLETQNRILVETDPNDLIWGIGLKEGQREIQNPDLWPGSNLMGFALMVVRDKIQSHD